MSSLFICFHLCEYVRGFHPRRHFLVHDLLDFQLSNFPATHPVVAWGTSFLCPLGNPALIIRSPRASA